MAAGGCLCRRARRVAWGGRRASAAAPDAGRALRPSSWAAGGLALALASGCLPAVEIDADETTVSAAPMAEFDPAARVVPLPNALLVDPASGRVNLPAPCGEAPGSGAEALRIALNQLDGFGTSRLSLVATFSEPVEPTSLDGRVLLVRLAEGGVPLGAPEPPVALDVVTTETQRSTADCAGSSVVQAVAIQPRTALRDASTYGVLIARGVRTQSGAEVQASPTWALVRQPQAPVTFATDDPAALPVTNQTPFDPALPEQLATLHGLDRLWRAHAPLLAALDQLAPALLPGSYAGRDDALLAWAFPTQTIDLAFDPSIEGSAASQIAASAAPLALGTPAAGAGATASIAEYYAAAFPDVPCQALACDAIGAIHAAGPLSAAPTLSSSSYLVGDDCTLPAVAGGAFDDPVGPTLTCQRALPLLAVLPASPPGAAGYPTLIFAHGLGRSKEDLLALAGPLARAGYASVAVDALDHGGRAVQVSTDPAAGCDRAGPDRPCSDSLGPGCAPQCYAPLLSPDLTVTRDHLRQTAFDHMALAAALAACASPGACGALLVDAAQIGFIGQSLGALIGGVSVARSPELGAAVLNVGGADWLQILTDTETPAIRCPLVDSLIAAGVLAGETWDGGANPDALCLGEDWKTDPGFLSFASAARWLLDPADGINHIGALPEGARPPVLLGEVEGDLVVPNSSTSTLGTALGLSATSADVAASATLEPSTSALMPGSVWLRYVNLDADPASQFPGNAYAHGSLLRPAEPSATMAAQSGPLGTLRMQVDSIGYLSSHLGGTP
jgi:dienelactone hydrolase